MPATRAIAFVALTMLLALSCTSEAGQTFYRWKDASGATHYTDTPPPPGAKQLPIGLPTREDIASNCSPKLTAEQCARYSASLKRDIDNMQRENATPEMQKLLREQREAAAGDAKRLQALKAQECDQKRVLLTRLQQRKENLPNQMRTDPSISGMSQAELEAQIDEGSAEVRQYLSANCNR
ncbi:DUF4124 domain-containing protein [Dyella tabacisoli]|uniref:DUF4124 domain-containing protein n=1 Tax=Dyella tabacisoli TaxID=2282381 RepID=A0A369UIJ8_9GAMM|nr:DUF4124 domain-containing protein [Dyella tabacisoli]RDD80173.1 DUF4124 domain-containing protein [Dyella tabacisoli]